MTGGEYSEFFGNGKVMSAMLWRGWAYVTDCLLEVSIDGLLPEANRPWDRAQSLCLGIR